MRSFHEPRDDHLFEFDEAQARAADRQRREAERNRLRAEEERVDAETKARATATTLATNRSQIIDEYAAIGVEPISVDDNGRPYVSLGFLLRSGWSVREISGRNTLVAPRGWKPAEPPEEKPSEDEIRFGEP